MLTLIIRAYDFAFASESYSLYKVLCLIRSLHLITSLTVPGTGQSALLIFNSVGAIYPYTSQVFSYTPDKYMIIILKPTAYYLY